MVLLRTCLIIILIIVCAVQVDMYGNGGSTLLGECDSMTPGHGGSSKNIGSSPYMVTTQQSTVTPGGSVSVTIKGEDSTKLFKGFMLQAHTVSGTRIGSWDASVPATASRVSCSRQFDTVTHNSRVTKNELTFLWSAPNSLSENVVFKSTFVVAYGAGNYYVKVPSTTVTLSQQQEQTTTTPQTAPPTTTHTPTTQPATTQPQSEDSSTTATAEPQPTSSVDTTSKQSKPQPTSTEAQSTEQQNPQKTTTEGTSPGSWNTLHVSLQMFCLLTALICVF